MIESKGKVTEYLFAKELDNEFGERDKDYTLTSDNEDVWLVTVNGIEVIINGLDNSTEENMNLEILASLIPSMTSYIEPNGKVDKSDEYPGRLAWQAFSGKTPNMYDASTFWYSSVENAWLSYEWENEISINKIVFCKNALPHVTIQYLKDGEWIDIKKFDSDENSNTFIEKQISLPNFINTKSIRFIASSSNNLAIAGVKVYGFNKLTDNQRYINMYVGETREFITTGIDEDNNAITWDIDDKSIATIDNGKVTAISSGTNKITATDGKEKAEFIINILKSTESLIPNMTSYTEPSGKVDKSDEYPGRLAWQAFSGRSINIYDGSTFWLSNTANAWVSYEWENEVSINKIIFFKHIQSSVKVQYIKDGIWIDIQEFEYDGSADNFIEKQISFQNFIKTKSIRFFSSSNSAIAIGGVKVLGIK